MPNHEHSPRAHEFHDMHEEHVHENHVCSSTCEHHQAAQYIDFMEPIERHDHAHEHGEGHIHGPGCGHLEYEHANLHVDHGKEKADFHDLHEAHVHGLDCGHMEYQHVHTEIDKPHVHDELCGHLDHHKAADHVDHGKNHKHNEHTDNHDEKEHVHGPNCGHVEYEEAHKHVDKSHSAESPVEHATEDARTSSDSRDEANERHTEDAAASGERQTETKATSEASGSSDALPVNETADPQPPAVTADKIRVEKQPVNLPREITEHALHIEPLQTISVLDTDGKMPANELEETDLSAELVDKAQIDMSLTFTEEEPNLELTVEPLFVDEYFEADNDTAADFVPTEEGDVLSHDFAKDLSQDIGIDVETLEEAPSMQLVEDLTQEELPENLVNENFTQELDDVSEFTQAEQRLDLSNFGNGQVPEEYSMEWPVSAEVNSDELENQIDTTRMYVARFMKRASEVDPSELEAMSDQLIAMLQSMPKESAEEVLPLVEELTEVYDLPKLEKLLELYFGGHFQEQNMFSRFVGSAGQDVQDISLRIGQAVLELIKSTSNSAQLSAA